MANVKAATVKGTMENAYNKPLSQIAVKEGFAPLPKSLDFSGDYEEIVDIESVRELNEYPKDSDIVDFVNAKRRANARQKAMQKVLDDAGAIRPTLENDDQLKLKKMFDVFMSTKKYSEAEAKALASSTLGIEWSE